MMTRRQLKILDILLKRKAPVKIEELLELLNKSERTIRYDISKLRTILSEHGGELRFLPQQGFYIPINYHVIVEKLWLDQYKIMKESTAQENVENEVFHTMLLLLGVSKYVKLSDFEDVLFISERAIFTYISNFELYYDHLFEIKNERNYGYFLDGDEGMLRLKMAEILIEKNKKFSSAELYIGGLPDIFNDYLSLAELVEICDIYKRANAKYQVWLDQEKFLIILNYLIVRYVRIKNFLSLDLLVNDSRTISPTMYTYCEELINSDDKEYKELEIETLAQILIDHNIFVNDAGINDPQVMGYVEQMIVLLQEKKYDANYKSLFNDLYLHFHAMLNHRSYVKNREEQLILEDIRNKYKYHYDLAESVVAQLEIKNIITIPKEEVGYVAIYLYKNKNSSLKKKKVVVVCSTGRGLSTLLVTRVKHVFPQIDVVEQLSFYQLENNEYRRDIDFIISTLPVKNKNYPVITISNVLSSNDIRKIYGFLNDEHSEKILRKYTLIDGSEAIDINAKSTLDLSKYSILVSEITLSLIEITTEIADEYPMKYDSILGLTIHLLMAIPRWLENRKDSYDDLVEKEFAIIELSHPKLVKYLDAFFLNVENTLLIRISIYERIAFYQYILRRKEDEKDSY